MEKEEYLRKHYKMQHGCFFSIFYIEHYGEDAVLYSYSNTIQCFIWNHAHVECMDLKKLNVVCNDVINFFESRDRKPCIYVDEGASAEMITSLTSKGFECVDNEAWMQYQDNAICYDKQKLNMVSVGNETELQAFLEVCSDCFDCEYSQAISSEYGTKYISKSKEHFVFWNNNVLVGIGSVYFDDDIAIIHNIGVGCRFFCCCGWKCRQRCDLFR